MTDKKATDKNPNDGSHRPVVQPGGGQGAQVDTTTPSVEPIPAENLEPKSPREQQESK